jgi:hypothetical protein
MSGAPDQPPLSPGHLAAAEARAAQAEAQAAAAEAMIVQLKLLIEKLRRELTVHRGAKHAALLEVRIEDRLAGRAPAPPGDLGESIIYTNSQE